MAEKPSQRDPVAAWENDGGRVNTAPREVEERGADRSRPSSPTPDQAGPRTQTAVKENGTSEAMSTNAISRTKVIIGAVVLIIGVALGAVSGTWLERQNNDERTAAQVQEEAQRAGRLEADVRQLHERADLLRTHLSLGRIAVVADRQDYGSAREQASYFFDELARIHAEMSTGDPRRAALQHVLATRDEVIAGLATAKPAAAQLLQQLYLELFAMDQAAS